MQCKIPPQISSCSGLEHVWDMEHAFCSFISAEHLGNDVLFIDGGGGGGGGGGTAHASFAWKNGELRTSWVGHEDLCQQLWTPECGNSHENFRLLAEWVAVGRTLALAHLKPRWWNRPGESRHHKPLQ